MTKENFNVTGMSCSACSARVERAVGSIVGADNVSVNLLTNSMQVKFDETLTSTADIIKAVVDAGYGASLKNQPSSVRQSARATAQPIEDEIASMRRRLMWSIAFLLPTVYIAMHSMLGLPTPRGVAELFDGVENAVTFAFAQFLLILPIMHLNRKYYINGLKLRPQSAYLLDFIHPNAGAGVQLYSEAVLNFGGDVAP